MKQKVLLGLLFAFVVVGFSITILRNSLRKEPEYNGKTISQWSEQWQSNRFVIHSGGQAAKAAAEEAEISLRQIGTNGIPFLLDLLRAREAPVIAKIRGLVPRAWHVRLRLNASENRAMRLNALGSFGLAALGTNAALAISSLIEVVETPTLGPDSVYRAVWTIKFLGPAAEPAIPSLIKCLGSSYNSSVRGEAVTTLGFINRRSEIVVPAIIEFLDWRTREGNGNAESINAIESLSRLGTNAAAAAPAVVARLNDPDQWIRTAATNCILRIDPAAASRAGIGQR